MKNKPRTFEQYIEYRNTLVTRRDARKRSGLLPKNSEDYYTIRIREIDSQYPQFKAMGHVKLKNKGTK